MKKGLNCITITKVNLILQKIRKQKGLIKMGMFFLGIVVGVVGLMTAAMIYSEKKK